MSPFDPDPPPVTADNSENLFDPYYEWLSIPPAEQPPNHYRLLGIEIFEGDSEVISEATDRQAAHVQTFKLSQHGNDCEKLLTEIFQAKVCLLKADRKAEYDEALRVEMGEAIQPFEPQVDVGYRIHKRRKKKSGLVELVKIVVGGLAGTVLAIIILRYGFGVHLFGFMAPKEPLVSKKVLVGDDKLVKGGDTEQLRNDLNAAEKDLLAARKVIDDLRSESVRLKINSTEKRLAIVREASEWIDMLPLIDVDRHAVGGRWRRNSEGITSDPARDARITVPSFLDGSYEVRVEITRHSGNESVSVILPVRNTGCVLYISGWAGSVHGIGMVDGKYPDAWPKNHELARIFQIQNNRRYRLSIQVTIQEDTVNIISQLDGVAFVTWNGKINRLSVAAPAAMPNRNSLGLGAFENRCTFSRIELRLPDSKKMALVPASIKEESGKK